VLAIAGSDEPLLLAKADALTDPDTLRALRRGEAVAVEAIREAALRERAPLARGVRPRRVRGVQLFHRRPRACLDDAALGDEVGDGVLRLAVAARRDVDPRRHAKALALPEQTPRDGPREHRRTADLRVAQRELELRVALLARDRVGERHEPQPSPHRVVVVAHPRRVVGEDPELELRAELEVVAVEVPRDDRVAAGELLHQALGHVASLVDLDPDDETPSVEAGDVRARSAAVAM